MSSGQHDPDEYSLPDVQDSLLEQDELESQQVCVKELQDDVHELVLQDDGEQQLSVVHEDGEQVEEQVDVEQSVVVLQVDGEHVDFVEHVLVVQSVLVLNEHDESVVLQLSVH